MQDFKLMTYKTKALSKPVLNEDAVGDGIIQQIVKEQADRKAKGGYTAIWTVREKHRSTGKWEPVRQRKNILTNFGLTALVSAYSGSFIVPNYLCYDNTPQTVGIASNIGDTTIYALPPFSSVLMGADNQLVLSVGVGTQETVTVTSTTPATLGGTGYTAYSISPAALNAHAASDPIVRLPTVTDTIAQMPNEQNYDPAVAPGLRAPSTAGYSSGIGNFILQFYLLSSQADGSVTGNTGNNFFGNVGTSDTPGVGTGNLHNIFPLGYLHNGGNDVEVDVSITIANS